MLPAGVWLRPEHYIQMLEDVSRRFPEEACGLLAGRTIHQPRPLPPEERKSAIQLMAETVIVMTNALHSPTRFRLQPQEQVNAFLWLEAQGLELIGIYHSHPHGPTHPSPTDLEEFAYPGTAYLIWSRHDQRRWRCRGYWIEAQSFRQIPLRIQHKIAPE